MSQFSALRGVGEGWLGTGVVSNGELALLQYGTGIRNDGTAYEPILANDGVVTVAAADATVVVNSADPQNPTVASNSVQSVTAGDATINIDNTDPQNPIITAPSGVGAVMSVNEDVDTTITVDNTDPQNPILSATFPQVNTKDSTQYAVTPVNFTYTPTAGGTGPTLSAATIIIRRYLWKTTTGDVEMFTALCDVATDGGSGPYDPINNTDADYYIADDLGSSLDASIGAPGNFGINNAGTILPAIANSVLMNGISTGVHLPVEIKYQGGRFIVTWQADFPADPSLTTEHAILRWTIVSMGVYV